MTSPRWRVSIYFGTDRDPAFVAENFFSLEGAMRRATTWLSRQGTPEARFVTVQAELYDGEVTHEQQRSVVQSKAPV